MIGVDTAGELLDFRGPRRAIDEGAAAEQLRGAVAVHNILEEEGVAYLADEVGMGKTYVALGALALFRHFDPGFRVLVIAPRENIQRKWMKELRSFVRNNVRFADLRVKAVHGAPARASVFCHNLVDLVHETGLNPDRDFFARLTSFSLPLGKDQAALKKFRDRIREQLPGIPASFFDLRSREAFKENVARAICMALPVFDLVVVDEGHNLKHGQGGGAAARNRVLALALGHPSGQVAGFAAYGPRARRVLFLSATPLESEYRQLWNQLDVVGMGDRAPELADAARSDEEKRARARRFLVRRVTSMNVAGEELTKNLYRREWRRGGVAAHDEPLELGTQGDDRQQLVVGLVQKKVSELLGHERFNNRFQIGMLASFESFLETAKVRRPQPTSLPPEATEGEDSTAVFDGSDQADSVGEREGIDVAEVNNLARSYHQRFGRQMPHPKMDALVNHLAAGLPIGRKALVFVRRIASVRELAAKLEERYDAWLYERLLRALPKHAEALRGKFAEYAAAKARRQGRDAESRPAMSGTLEEEGAALDPSRSPGDLGGLDTFFAWYFRGEGPPDVWSGATLQKRFGGTSGTYSTFFEENYTAWLLGASAGQVLWRLAEAVGRPVEGLTAVLLQRAAWALPGSASKRLGRYHLFLAMQEAAVGLLAEEATSRELSERARVVLQALIDGVAPRGGQRKVPAGAERYLEEETFFFALRGRPELCTVLWPEVPETEFRQAFRQRELRRLLLSAMARLGQASIDLYCLAAARRPSLGLNLAETEEEEGREIALAFVDLLERQRREGIGELCAFTELAQGASHFDLIVDVNVPDLRAQPLTEAARTLGTLLGSQQPVGAMHGGVNQSLVRQFRMPGYPLVLVSTDLLQEGEDLHTFCSSVYHYGISWMPSSMEQRVGRVDRVRSATARRLKSLDRPPLGEEKLQVFYPHLADTVELLQVRRVLERLDRFLRLMHQDLGQSNDHERRLDVATEALRTQWEIAPITEPLRTAFPIREELLAAPSGPLAVKPEDTAGLWSRFRALAAGELPGLSAEWERESPEDALHGTARVGKRRQPFTLLLRSIGGRPLLRCVSPAATSDGDTDWEAIEDFARRVPVQMTASCEAKATAWRLAAEAEALLVDPAADRERAAWLVRRVTQAADQIEHLVEPGADAEFAVLRDELEKESDGAD